MCFVFLFWMGGEGLVLVLVVFFFGCGGVFFLFFGVLVVLGLFWVGFGFGCFFGAWGCVFCGCVLGLLVEVGWVFDYLLGFLY